MFVEISAAFAYTMDMKIIVSSKGMRDVEEGEFSVRNGVRILRSWMKVGSFCTKLM